MAYVNVLIGFVLLFACAELLVRGSVAMAERLGVAPLVVGLTVVAFGTSAPELVVSVNAALAGSPSIAVGNVVGSNIANILLILGVAGLAWPIPAGDKRAFLRDSGTVLAASAAFALIVLGGTIERWMGLVMVGALIAFVVITYWREKRAGPAADHAQEVAEFEQFKTKPWWLIIGATLAGLGGVVLGADLLVAGATVIAQSFGVPEAVIGLTLVAFGTSLPELATTLAAAWHKHTDLAMGNVLGSCLFNILAIMGVTATIVPIPVPDQIARFDIWVMIAAIAILMPLGVTGRRIGRGEALFFAIAYGLYVVILYYGVDRILGVSAA